MCIHCLEALRMVFPLFGKSLLVLQDQDQISSRWARLQFSLTGTSTRDSFMLHFVLAFMVAVNHSILRGLIYVSAFPTTKPRTCALCWASSQHGTSFLALSRHPINHGCSNIREEGPAVTLCFYRIEALRGQATWPGPHCLRVASNTFARTCRSLEEAIVSSSLFCVFSGQILSIPRTSISTYTHGLESSLLFQPLLGSKPVISS